MDRKKAEAMAQRLAGEGRAIEEGWRAYRQHCMPPDAGEIQVRETRFAFYSACSYVLDMLALSCDPGEDVTANDERRMELIGAELTRFEAEFKQLGPPSSRAPLRSCPRCGRITANLEDIRQGYCGACHDWT